MDMIKNIINVIQKNHNFLLTTHLSPDGDALGSIIALGLALEKLNKKVDYYIDPSIPEKFNFLPKIQNLSCNVLDKQYEIGIILDCGDINHLYDRTILKKCNTIINIDHHINNQNYGNMNYINSKAGATGEIIYEIIEFLGVELDHNISKALYTAIVTDTGNFKYSNVTSKTHYIVSELLRIPIDAWKINKKLFDEYPRSKIFLVKRAIDNLQFLLGGRLAIIVITQDDLKDIGCSPKEIEGIINIARNIIGVEVAILLKETASNEFKISFRSNEYVDVGEIALRLGGGGHSRASGCIMHGNRDEIMSILKGIVEKKL
ncbi:DHH family phosphoesterase [Garciella nitratireducens]|uniref:DHH family phosphoesterase n=2 Tax=Garciella nitratireducens TaxID=218205 RepID=UPI001BD486F9|nr:bifunctional oligoribonuclease/PAP phosphatase NrnA [Garciella nitratireducens]